MTVANLAEAQIGLPVPQPTGNPGFVQPAPKSPPSLSIPTVELFTTPAASTNNEDKARIERLEKQVQELSNALRSVQSQPAQLAAPVSTAAPQAGLSASDVRSIINGYFAEQDEKKKVEAKAKPKDEWYEVGSDPSAKAKWAFNRLTFESPQKDFKAHLGGRLQFDNYWMGASQAYIKSFPNGSFDDGNFFRRIRIEFDGQAYENFEWNFEVDLERNALFEKNQAGAVVSNGNFPPTRFDEVYLGLRNLPIIGNVRVGNVRPPMGLECYTSSRNLWFLERSSGFEAFLQEFAPGIWFFNDFNERVFWAATVDRPNFSVQKAGEYGNGDIAFTGRIAGLPIYENDGRCLVHVGASYQYRKNQDNTAFAASRSTSYSAPGDWRATYFTPNLVSTGTFLSDHSNFVGLEFLAIWGPVRVQAEYFGVQAGDVVFPAANGKAPTGNRNFNSGYVAAGYVLTGENHRYDKRLGRIDRFQPNENFYFVRGEDGSWQRGIGAWEVAARWDWIDLNDGPIKGGYMNNYTLGLNWYWNTSIKWQLNWTMTDRAVAGAPVGAGASGHTPLLHAVGVRVQWEF